MDMTSHTGMQHETNLDFILLYVGIFILIVAIIALFTIKKEEVYGMKKEQRAILRGKNKRIKRISYALFGVSFIVLVIFLITITANQYDLKTLNYNTPIQVTEDPSYGAGHSVDPVQYVMKIPTSGTHSPHDIKFGFYETKPATELLVHNLEHGDIIIHYRPSIDASVLDRLKYLVHFRKEGAGILAVPNDDIPQDKEIVVTAWMKTMELTTFNEESIGTFIYQFINKGPEVIPPSIRQNGGTM